MHTAGRCFFFVPGIHGVLGNLCTKPQHFNPYISDPVRVSLGSSPTVVRHCRVDTYEARPYDSWRSLARSFGYCMIRIKPRIHDTNKPTVCLPHTCTGADHHLRLSSSRSGLRFDLTKHVSPETGSNKTETSNATTSPSHKLGLALSETLSGLTQISKY